MICEARYNSLDAIPEALRDEFEQINGEWRLKVSAIHGVGPLFNSALAANESKAVGQVKTRNEKIKVLEEENNQLKDKLSILDTPGNKVLSKEDATTFDAYATLGTPSELKAKLEQLPDLEGNVKRFETTEALTKVAKAAGEKLNPEVLTDWLSSDENKGITAFVKTETQTDSKGAKVEVEVPYLRIEAQENGQTTVSEKDLLTFAKEKMPEWKYNALTAGGSAAPTQPAPNQGIRLPDLNSAQREPGADGVVKRPVDKFNEARAARPSPFAAKTAIVVGGVPQVR